MQQDRTGGVPVLDAVQSQGLEQTTPAEIIATARARKGSHEGKHETNEQ